jgi:hypothetical protein
MGEISIMSTRMTTIDVIARCLAAASLCVKDGNNRRANVFMKGEFREMAREVSRWELGGEAKASLLLHPMEKELVSRYGSLLGRRLYWDFVDAFWLQSWTNEPLIPSSP